MIPHCIVKAIGQEGISGVYIEAELSMCQEIKTFIFKTFEMEWEKACIAVKNKYGDCLEYANEWPSGIDIYPWEKGLFITFQALYLSYDNGAQSDTEFAIKALEKTLLMIRERYPKNNYYGCIAFSDCCGQFIQRDFCSPDNEEIVRYDFMEKIIEYIDNNVDSFTDYLEVDSNGKPVEELIDFLHIYEDKFDCSLYDRVLKETSIYIDEEPYYELEDKVELLMEQAGYKRPFESSDDAFSKPNIYQRLLPEE